MPSQNPGAPDIPFTYTHSQRNFRLVELPPPLLELLSSSTSADPTLTLHLKSFPTDLHGKAGKDGNVRLCTPTQTYLVRQVSSSNSVFLARPSTTSAADQNGQLQGGDDDDDMEVDTGPDLNDGTGLRHEAALTAIAQCPSMLELQLLERDLARTVLWLKDVLPVYGVDDGRTTKKAIYEDIPVSDAEIDAAMRHMCAFEAGGFAWRPTAGRTVAVWGWVRECVDRRLRLGLSCQKIGDLDMETPLEDSEVEWPGGQDIWTLPIKEILTALETHGVLDRAKCCGWIGEKVLEDVTTSEEAGGQGMTSGLDKEVFLERWKNAMPERWRDNVAGLEVLDRAVYETTPTGKIRWIDPTTLRVGAKQAEISTPSTVKTGGHRKWHEKFKAGRR